MSIDPTTKTTATAERAGGFLIHLVPKFYGRFERVEIVELTIEPLGLRLTSNDLATRQPYPNKQYFVACRRKGRRAMDGILIRAQRCPTSLVRTARWAINAEICVTHRVEYSLLDSDFDAITDSTSLWRQHSKRPGSGDGDWQRRLPPGMDDGSCYVDPRMEVRFFHEPNETEARRRARCVDVLDERGLIVERTEPFTLPTIESGRLWGWLADRAPAASDAFEVSRG